MRREYYLHQRNGVYYVEFVDTAKGGKLSAKSTGERDRERALKKVEAWKENGVPAGRWKRTRPLEDVFGIEVILNTIRAARVNADDAMKIVAALKKMDLVDYQVVKNSGRGAVPFTQFLHTFWDYDKSEYIRDRLAHGHRFTRLYAHRSQVRLAGHIHHFFGEKKLNCVTTGDLKKFSNELAQKGLATATINHLLLLCCTPLKWAFNEKIIPVNPTLGLTRFSVTNKRRGVLTEAEAAAIFAVEWKDNRAFVASLVSATTGARKGECLALRKNDIGEKSLSIAHSYSYIDGLKCPKNGHKRVVPLLPEIRSALLALLEENPHNVDNPFLFYSKYPDRPADGTALSKGLQSALESINVDYRSRNICFHSWRHYFVSRITNVIEGEKVAKVSGHLSEAIFRKYADHIEEKNIQEVGKAAAVVFAGMVRRDWGKRKTSEPQAQGAS